MDEILNLLQTFYFWLNLVGDKRSSLLNLQTMTKRKLNKIDTMMTPVTSKIPIFSHLTKTNYHDIRCCNQRANKLFTTVIYVTVTWWVTPTLTVESNKVLNAGVLWAYNYSWQLSSINISQNCNDRIGGSSNFACQLFLRLILYTCKCTAFSKGISLSTIL
jgi:hypothetical protein